ncbi:hypothetical protein FOA52_009489 [Chlamydomonas sp. UWO 241]|nr:hypothetical protein FOA52_009489 [Chlamydomonas sp. UWO 241]
MLEVATEAKEVFQKRYEECGVTVYVVQSGANVVCEITCDEAKKRNLHWGVDEWQKPAEATWPAGTFPVDDKAVQTPFEGGRKIVITVPSAECPTSLSFVLREMEPEEKWINGGNCFTAILSQPDEKSILSKADEK